MEKAASPQNVWIAGRNPAGDFVGYAELPHVGAGDEKLIPKQSAVPADQRCAGHVVQNINLRPLERGRYARRATSMKRMTVTHCAAETQCPAPVTRFIYMLAGVMISPTNTPPIMDLMPKPFFPVIGRRPSSSRNSLSSGIIGAARTGGTRLEVRRNFGGGHC